MQDTKVYSLLQWQSPDWEQDRFCHLWSFWRDNKLEVGPAPNLLTSSVLDKTFLPLHRFKYIFPQKVALRDRKKQAGNVNTSWKHSLKDNYYYYCYYYYYYCCCCYSFWQGSLQHPSLLHQSPSDHTSLRRFYLRTVTTEQLPGAPGWDHTSRLPFPAPGWAGARGSLRKPGKGGTLWLQNLSSSLCELPRPKWFHSGNPQHLPVCF